MEKAKELLLRTGKLSLKVTPRARKQAVEGFNAAGELVVKVRAVAEDGKANEAVIALLAAVCELPKSALSIVHGHTSRNKVIALIRK